MTVMITNVVHSLVFVQIVVGLFWALSMRLSAATTDELEQLLAQAFIDAMHAAHLSFKEMAFAMELDEGQLSRQLSRERGQHLSIYRLLRAPFSWWMHFGPSLMLVVAKKRWQELASDTTHLRRSA